MGVLGPPDGLSLAPCSLACSLEEGEGAASVAVTQVTTPHSNGHRHWGSRLRVTLCQPAFAHTRVASCPDVSAPPPSLKMMWQAAVVAHDGLPVELVLDLEAEVEVCQQLLAEEPDSKCEHAHTPSIRLRCACTVVCAGPVSLHPCG